MTPGPWVYLLHRITLLQARTLWARHSARITQFPAIFKLGALCVEAYRDPSGAVVMVQRSNGEAA